MKVTDGELEAINKKRAHKGLPEIKRARADREIQNVRDTGGEFDAHEFLLTLATWPHDPELDGSEPASISDADIKTYGDDNTVDSDHE